jgi:S-adenosyl methyltransferase
VLSHAAALLADDKSTFVADGDLRDPAGLLAHPDVRSRYLDWEQPIGLLMCGHPALPAGRRQSGRHGGHCV